MSHPEVSARHRQKPSLGRNPVPLHEHTVQFYETEAYLYDAMWRFLASGLRDDNPILIIATPEHHTGYRQYLRANGFDLDVPVASGQVLLLDARSLMNTFMHEGLPDPARFAANVGRLLQQCQLGREGRTLFAYGEMVDVLWKEGRWEAAVRLEELWNELAVSHSFTLFCAYAMNGFYKEVHSLYFEDICRKHSAVIPTESHMKLNNEGQQALEVAVLQQRAIALEAEITRRKEVEAALLSALEERRKDEERLRRTESELRDFLQNAVECLQWISPEGEILWANQAELDLIGYSRDEYIGHHISEFHVDREVVEDLLKRLKGGESLCNYEACLRSKDGSVRHVIINSSALRENGNVVRIHCFTRDISERRHAEDTEAFLSAIIGSADDAIVSKTLDGIVTSWNPGAEKLFGYSATEMIGKPISILIPEYHVDEEPRILEKLRRGERIDHYETQRVRKDGTIIDISLTVSPVRDQRGRIIGASKIARDITERKRMESERDQILAREQAARSDAEAASRMKDQFLAILSHELRTPLNAILGWTGILAARKDEDSVGRAVEVIQRNAAMQKRLIEDLLDMARILTGKMIIKSEMVDLVAIVNAALDSVAPAAAAKGIKLDSEVDEQVRFITGDADRLQQVVWNLLSNAIKFTPDSGHVQLHLRKTDSQIEIRVQDSGQGISPDFLPHVFERFRQADGSTARQHGGLGLGLAVVRHLVEAHGGRVFAKSEGKDRGSTFVVSLPAASNSSCISIPADDPLNSLL